MVVNMMTPPSPSAAVSHMPLSTHGAAAHQKSLYAASNHCSSPRQKFQLAYGSHAAASLPRASSALGHRKMSHDNEMNVENVMLQNQVDTLQWQLKQVETSCEMYRSVMEEVARFLDRCCNQKELLAYLEGSHLADQMKRSKSLHHVDDGHHSDLHSVVAEVVSSPHARPRSSTSCFEANALPTSSQKPLAKPAKLNGKAKAHVEQEQKRDGITSEDSYSAFKDFTWHRSPKKYNGYASKQDKSAEEIREKFTQEAFRLSRTIHNLLNTSTQQPDLTQHRNSLASVAAATRLGKSPTASMMTLPLPMHNSTALTGGFSVDANATITSTVTGAPHKGAPLPANEMMFLYSSNMRASHLSLRSSTDSSVHSTTSSAASSSSKVETDEEPTPFLAPSQLTNKHVQTAFCANNTEDESGFSSISSFQEVGLPLSSTVVSNASTGKSTELQCQLENIAIDSRDSTLKSTNASAPAPTANVHHANNVLGVPLNTAGDMLHRWDMPSKTYRKANRNQRFSTLSHEEAGAVLWV